jgi:hypothetical protein
LDDWRGLNHMAKGAHNLYGVLIVADERSWSVKDAAQIVEEGLVDVVNIKLSRLGVLAALEVISCMSAHSELIHVTWDGVFPDCFSVTSVIDWLPAYVLWLRDEYILEYMHYCGEYVVAVVAGRHSAHNMGNGGSSPCHGLHCTHGCWPWLLQVDLPKSTLKSTPWNTAAGLATYCDCCWF